MFYKIIFFLVTVATLTSVMFQVNAPQAKDTVLPTQSSPETIPTDFSNWFIVDETSAWTPEEIETVTRALRNSFAALEQAGLDGETLLGGYHFRRYAGEYAKGKKGKIALTNFVDLEITLSDSIFLPENEFYIYHELGHVVDARSGGALNNQFHALTMQIEGVTTLHDWTTAQGFFLRGPAHVHKPEATADAFALWVYVAYMDNPVPEFPHMPKNGDPDAIIRVYEEALAIVF